MYVSKYLLLFLLFFLTLVLCSSMANIIDINKRGGAYLRILSQDTPEGTKGPAFVDREFENIDHIIIGSGTTKEVEGEYVTIPGVTVSEFHARIFFLNGSMYIHDVGSQYGTFLNGRRLSLSYHRSSTHLIINGDKLQFGRKMADAKQNTIIGTNAIVELKTYVKLNKFEFQTYCELRKISPPSEAQTLQSLMSDCAICLNAIAPLQSLFVAPCSHSFHFSCSKPLLDTYPEFECPVCRICTDVRVYTSSDVNTLANNFKMTNIN
ncbi:hypothetical protein J3Q64DRAFT_1823956 [Phycomyces blakesleeanus]|uniref:RING-type domain-containing protein n=2 Tax=Phycomyces blakesleeanus TaxID=4837 RepID=A0A167KZV4_PHYB8|nr:hypothetical protein PHYBLDRAFT_172511 [Phycomyces blakesleeanus NRRL 1555(-)]OAD69259.1 hypothetical protein PHYBLDRAFT_172511 [Phycomyces blakesleeanus NRRL 1555(-)]|eukprot:XP_018287299.1 hypothetical protein PHYBLDRAFT_172511 [Phycomyces blakesleeanus NRRL 1555(-)]